MVVMIKRFKNITSSFFNSPFVVYATPIVLLILPIILLLLPADFFDNGKPICLSVVFFNAECYGCGMTRAIMHLIHFDIDGAIDYNLLSFIVLPFLVILWVIYFTQSVQKLKKLKNIN